MSGYLRAAKNGRNPTGTIAAGASLPSLFTFKEIFSTDLASRWS